MVCDVVQICALSAQGGCPAPSYRRSALTFGFGHEAAFAPRHRKIGLGRELPLASLHD
jgi:hypothetical protein